MVSGALKTRYLFLITLLTSAALAYLWGASNWLPAYLREARGFSLREMGWLASLPQYATVVAVLVGGVIIDRIERQRVPLIFLVASVGVALSILLAISVQDRYVAAYALIAANFCWGLQSPAIPSTVQYCSRPEHIASAYGVVNGVASLVAAFMPALMGGVISANAAGGSGTAFYAGFSLLIGTQVVVFLCGLVLWLRRAGGDPGRGRAFRRGLSRAQALPMVTSVQRCKQMLRKLPLFQSAKEADLDAVASLARLDSLPRKGILFKRGDPCSGFHVIAYGRLMLSLVSSQGIEKPLQVAEPGDSLGDITMFLERPYYLTAEALEDSLLVYVSRQAIMELIERDGHFALRMLASLSLRMRMVVDDMESFLLQPPASRLAIYLLRLVPPGIVKEAHIELTIKKSVVAAQLNLTPATLSRYFKELSDGGLITLKGRSVLIHDIEKLGEYLAGKSKPTKS